MKTGFIVAGVVASAIVGVGALGWVAVGNSYLLSKIFAPKFEQVRRTTFEQSQAYVEGQRRDIQNLRIDWLGSRGDQKAAISSVALQRIAGLPPELVTDDVLAFRNELQGANQ